MNKHEKIKVAVVGVGSISSTHIEAYLADPRVELCAFCDIDGARLQYMGKQYGITALYTDEAEMLREIPELDAVSVCTWNSAHAPCTIMALDAGKHVLCEKPMAMSTEEAEQMLEAARRNDRKLMIRFDNGFVLSVETGYSLNVDKEENLVQLFGSLGGMDISMGRGVRLYSEMDGYLTNVDLVGKTAFDGRAYPREIEAFIQYVIGEEECRNPAEDGVEMMRILDAVYRSAASGHEEVVIR